ncbi:hypothetical protein AB840_03815 [Megasphaera cerevisiae DSM 20462]|uniref:Uncharacterized protein n=1 Tax=Megasphaera cerevisiae DSM 20462 TaxID=1122219 RepID=A0A0J6ZQE5_9FIRM|nr:hypothetical protein [Megasphaera cerevisiae]KMO87171.1 hypothetical protein AB840_03815 [Megasphaera cerevisiae DSM 20462]SJZ59545.1 hypothetical protein SAMN05660900_00891 [Megasphaera cerevisiae DSM 20462]
MEINKKLIVSHDIDDQTSIQDEINLDSDNLKDMKHNYDITIDHNVNKNVSLEVELSPSEIDMTATIKI